MTRRSWVSIPYLDALRPEPGWRTEFAVLATYSLDLIALVAALLALGGADDEQGSGSKVDFARSFDQLRGRVFVLAQDGRVAAPRKCPRVLGLLDRFIRTMPLDENEGSWHPKVSLVMLQSEVDGEIKWRLWLGSRNLSRDSSWDVGLTLVGRPSIQGKPLAGVVEIAQEMLAHTDLPESRRHEILRELRRVHWEMPAGFDVAEVRWLRHGKRGIPEAPDRLKLLIVVSPFVDGGIVGRLGEWGDAETRRILVSTQKELSKLGAQKGQPLRHYQELLHFDAPELESAEAEDDTGSASDDGEIEQRGLHAKLIYAEHGAERTLWFGSANATERGWNGPNAEVVARASISRDLGAGLEDFIKGAGRVAHRETLLDYREDLDEQRFDAARRQIVSRWQVTARYRDGGLQLNAKCLPHPDAKAARLQVALIGGAWVEWPRTSLSVPLGKVGKADLTELAQCRLTLGELSATWIQRTLLDPPLDDERDRLAMARYLDPRTFLLWVRSLLTLDGISDGGGDWDEGSARVAPSRSHQEGPVWWAPTLEEVLRAWTRDPASVMDVDRKVRRYLHVVGEHADAPLTATERQVLSEFRETWAVLRAQLVERVR